MIKEIIIAAVVICSVFYAISELKDIAYSVTSKSSILLHEYRVVGPGGSWWLERKQ